MKALIVFRENENTDNLFVPILRKAIQSQGIDIRCSTEEFWNSETAYDIVHFQWPEEVVGWNCYDPAMIERLSARIDFFRKNGAKFVYTRHNTRPHYGNEVISAVYQVIEENADLIVHMGQYSMDEFRTKYPKSRNILIPHHIYENTYNETTTQAEARKRLGIPAEKFVITAFGKFRNREEILMVLSAFRKLKLPGKFLLAPRLYPFSKHPQQRNIIKRLTSLLGYYLLVPAANYFWHMKAGASEELIDNADLPDYMAASDVVFVQRKQILNSGNIPLAFLFHKIPIGPNTANVGEWLRKTGNPTFDANDTKSIVRALQEAEILSKNMHGEKNYQYAQTHCALSLVSKQYIEVYETL